jgi:ParB/RepB/Spo0J family partition protein
MKTTFAAGVQPAADFRTIPLEQIMPSPLNPRRAVTGDQLEELAASIREKGLLQPVLVRPGVNGAGAFELVCGHRRLAAAQVVGLEELPAIVRELDDQAVLEIQVIENLQRADLHPLEEAESYRRLLLVKGYDVARIAEKIGRSVKYVYDRVKLLELTKEAKKLFLEDKITAGHAILLARLKPKDQERAIDPDVNHHHPALFVEERTLWDPQADEEEDEPFPLARNPKDPYLGIKPRSVRELQAWIDVNVRFDAKAPDPMLFPATAETLATTTSKRIVPITQANFIPPEARDGRTWGPRSWKRADGQKGSKTCDYGVTGFIAVGPGRGDAFTVCVNKEKCTVHWGAELRAKQKRTGKAAAKAGVTVDEQARREREKAKAAEEQKEAAKQRWARALPAIRKAVAERVRKMPANATSLLADVTLSDKWADQGAVRMMPRGKTAEDLVRHLAFLDLYEETGQWDAHLQFPKRAKQLGIDVAKILDEAAPVEKPVKPRDSGSGTTRSKRAAKKGGKKK